VHIQWLAMGVRPQPRCLPLPQDRQDAPGVRKGFPGPALGKSLKAGEVDQVSWAWCLPTFAVTISASPAGMERGPTHEAKGDAVGDIVLIDDNEDQLELMALALSRMSARSVVRRYSSGEAAVADLARAGRSPRLVCVDVQMPGLDGPATVVRLRALACIQGVPVVMLSNSDLAEDRARSRSAGADDYVLKPSALGHWFDAFACVSRHGLDSSDER